MKARLLAAVAAVAALAATSLAVAGSAKSVHHKSAASLSVVSHVAASDAGWDYASYDPENHHVLVARTNGALSLDTRTGAVTPVFVPGNRLHGAIAIPGGLGLNTNGADNSVTVFESATGKVLGTTPAGKNPDAAVYDPHSKLVFVMDHTGAVTVVDPRAIKVVGTIQVGGALEFAAPDGKGKLFVNVEDKNEIVAIDTKTMSVLAHHALKSCDGPSGLAFAPRHDALVAVCDGKADVVSAKTGKVLQVLDIGKGPDAAIYDSNRDVVFVPCGRDGRLDVISFGAHGASVSAHVPTAMGARTGTLDTDTGKLYLPTAKFAAPVAPARRGAMVPGSFELLVVG